MKNNFEERKENRIDAAKDKAAQTEKDSDQLYQQAKKMADFIPFGQPILVGHHSEKRDRNFRKKIHNTFGKAFEASDKAKYYEDRATSIENNDAIFSDDPQAIEKLESKIKELTALQDFMKAANQCIRKKDKAGFLSLQYSNEKLWEELNTPDCFKHTGFASYSLTNNNANISRLKKRLESLKVASNNSNTETIIKGVKVIQNAEANRMQLIFNGKPDEETRKQLKQNGFRWCPSEGAWQRHLNGNGIYAAERFLENYNG